MKPVFYEPTLAVQLLVVVIDYSLSLIFLTALSLSLSVFSTYGSFTLKL